MYVFHKTLINTHTQQGGGYLNPAITASLMALYPLNKGKMSPLQGLLNMLAQLLGTAVGIALVVRFFSTLTVLKAPTLTTTTHTHRSESFQMQTRVMKIWAYQHLLTVRLQEADLLSKPWEHSLWLGSFWRTKHIQWQDLDLHPHRSRWERQWRHFNSLHFHLLQHVSILYVRYVSFYSAVRRDPIWLRSCRLLSWDLYSRPDST